MQWFWNDVVHFAPGVISGLSLCWKDMLSLGTPRHIDKNTEFSFLMEKELRGKYSYNVRGSLYSIMMYYNGIKRLKMVINEGCLIYEAYCAAGGCENNVFHQAKTDVDLVCFDGRLLHSAEFQQKYPLLIANVLTSTSLKYIMFDALLECMYNKSAIEKVAWYIDKLCENQQEECRVTPGLTQNEVASQLGISKASMTRVLTQLKEEGIIAGFTKKSIVITDKKSLKRLSQAG